MPTIHHLMLCRLLFRKLHDPRTQALIQLLLASGGAVYRTPLVVQVLELERYPMDDACGLALGSYLSRIFPLILSRPLHVSLWDHGWYEAARA